MTMHTVDLLSSILRLLVEITRKLCSKIESDEFICIAAILGEREQLLNQQKKIVEEWKISHKNADDRSREVSQLRPLVELLRQVDEEFVTLFTCKREELAEKLKQAHNQSLLLVYSR